MFVERLRADFREYFFREMGSNLIIVRNVCFYPQFDDDGARPVVLMQDPCGLRELPYVFGHVASDV